jgi:class 3 adenylate cyclase
MRGVPETRYARLGDDYIAYQVIGEGPPDLVLVPHWNSNVEALWDFPPLARFVRHLAGFGRVVLFDKRGTGLSDALSSDDAPFLEQFADDLRAVLDAVGSSRVAIIAADTAGLVAIAFAAGHPDRVTSLVLVNSFAGLAGAGSAGGSPAGEVAEHARDIFRIWLDGDVSRVAQSIVGDVAGTRELIRLLRLSASPRAAHTMRQRILELDVTDVLSSVQTPTLVLHRRENPFFPVDHGRHLATHIPGARFVELPGADHLMYLGDVDRMLGEIELFVAGERRHMVSERVLTTVLFIDIVRSTSHAVEVGDRRWRALLDGYDAEVARNLDVFRGQQVKNIGDGTLATFDGPARAIRCALAVREAVAPYGLDLRCGLHTGEVEVRGEDVSGIAVHTAQRVQSHAEPGEVLVSRTVMDLVAGSGIAFQDRGEHELKGVPGAWRLFAVDA